MKALDHYIILRTFLWEREQEQSVTCTLTELMHVLCCTKKNVKRILHKLEEEGWLHYEPGLGRGNVSSLTYENAFMDDLYTIVQRYLEEGKMESCLQLFDLSLPKHMLEPLAKLLQDSFGLRSKEEQDILRIPIKRKLAPLDPTRVYITMESHIVHQVFDTLVHFDEAQNTIRPHVAHAWEYDAERFVWTFYLRKGIYFHHGKALTSEDVVYSFYRLKNEDGPNAWMMDDVLYMTTPHPQRLDIYLRQDSALFLHYVSSTAFSILPNDIAFQCEKLIGTGPFLFQQEQGKIRLRAYDRYFKERALLDEVHLIFVPIETSVNFSYEVPSNAEKQTIRTFGDGCRYLAFNFHKQWAHDSYIRKAFYELLDGDALLAAVEREDSMPSYSFFPAKSTKRNVKKSMIRAKRYIAKSTYKGETLHLYFLKFPQSTEDAIWLEAQCAKIGIHLALHPFDIRDCDDKSIIEQADFLLMGEEFNQNTHLSFLNAFQNKTSFLSSMLAGPLQTQLHTLLAKYKKENDARKRELYMDEIENYIQQEHLFVFIYHQRRMRSFPAPLQGVAFHNFGWTDFRRVWIKPEDV